MPAHAIGHRLDRRVGGGGPSDNEVNAAKKSALCICLNLNLRQEANRTRTRTCDIVKMLVQCDRSNLTRFVALNLSKLPPVSIYCTHIELKAPVMNEHLYVNRHQRHSMDVQAVCNTNMEFADMVAKLSGT